MKSKFLCFPEEGTECGVPLDVSCLEVRFFPSNPHQIQIVALWIPGASACQSNRKPPFSPSLFSTFSPPTHSVSFLTAVSQASITHINKKFSDPVNRQGASIAVIEAFNLYLYLSRLAAQNIDDHRSRAHANSAFSPPSTLVPSKGAPRRHLDHRLPSPRSHHFGTIP